MGWSQREQSSVKSRVCWGKLPWANTSDKCTVRVRVSEFWTYDCEAHYALLQAGSHTVRTQPLHQETARVHVKTLTARNFTHILFKTKFLSPAAKLTGARPRSRNFTVHGLSWNQTTRGHFSQCQSRCSRSSLTENEFWARVSVPEGQAETKHQTSADAAKSAKLPCRIVSSIRTFLWPPCSAGILQSTIIFPSSVLFANGSATLLSPLAVSYDREASSPRSVTSTEPVKNLRGQQPEHSPFQSDEGPNKQKKTFVPLLPFIHAMKHLLKLMWEKHTCWFRNSKTDEFKKSSMSTTPSRWQFSHQLVGSLFSALHNVCSGRCV